jgi:hypothetical protein
MNKTGRYVFDKAKGEFVRVSDRPPNVQVFDCFVPEGGYYSENLGTFVESRSQKRRILKERGLAESNSKLTRREL